MRLLITGSRTWDDSETMDRELEAWWKEQGKPMDVTLVHGGARGADLMAESIWESQGFPTEKHPAPWQDYGHAAGPIRNAEMVRLGADYCLAFIRDGSNGAMHCAQLAELAGIPTKRIMYPWPEVE